MTWHGPPPPPRALSCRRVGVVFFSSGAHDERQDRGVPRLAAAAARALHQARHPAALRRGVVVTHRVLPCVMCRHVLSCQIDDGHQAPRHTPRCSSARWCRHVPRQFTRSCAMPRHQRGVHQTPSSPSPLLFDDEARHVCVCVINGAAVRPPPPRLPPLNQIATRASGRRVALGTLSPPVAGAACGSTLSLRASRYDPSSSTSHTHIRYIYIYIVYKYINI